MKKLIIGLSLLNSLTLFASENSSATIKQFKNLKEIVCQSTVTYDEESPNDKTSLEKIFIFKKGLRKMNDTKNETGKTSFVLTEYDKSENGGLVEDGDQQFYFNLANQNKIAFEFLANWKASGELELLNSNEAIGFINQKSHITELKCALSR